MLIYVLDNNFAKVGIIDNASSVIFTKRYNSVGDFEVHVAASDDAVQLLTQYPYVYKDGDDTVYKIKKIIVQSDVEAGNYITVSGDNIACVLGQRIVWGQTTVSGTVEEAIRRFIDENAITTDSARVIPRLQLSSQKNFTDTIRIQRTGENLLDVVRELCKTYQYGFRVLFDGTNLTFDLYQGTLRNVFFSPDFDNLISSDYRYSEANYKNVVLVAGEGDGSARTRASAGTATGMDRYELYVDARDISSNDGQIASEDYSLLLVNRGVEKLSEHEVAETFDGEVSTEHTYKLGVDYDLGDIVTIRNEYGMTAMTRIVETIECEDESGYSFIPTFDTWKIYDALYDADGHMLLDANGNVLKEGIE